MPKRLATPAPVDRSGTESWTHVDLFEFLRPAVWALSAFMVTPRWWDNHELILAALHGQTLFMVRDFSLIYLFVLFNF